MMVTDAVFCSLIIRVRTSPSRPLIPLHRRTVIGLSPAFCCAANELASRTPAFLSIPPQTLFSRSHPEASRFLLSCSTLEAFVRWITLAVQGANLKPKGFPDSLTVTSAGVFITNIVMHKRCIVQKFNTQRPLHGNIAI